FQILCRECRSQSVTARYSGASIITQTERRRGGRILFHPFLNFRLFAPYLGDAAGAHGPATLTHGEAEALRQGGRLDLLDRHLGFVAGHDDLGALGQRDDAGDVGGPEVELRTVVRVERVVTAALVLGQDVDLRLEVGVRGDRPRLGHDLAALDVLTLGATQEQTAVLAGPRLVHLLVEHLDARDDRLLGLTDAEDLDLGVDRELAAVHLAG